MAFTTSTQRSWLQICLLSIILSVVRAQSAKPFNSTSLPGGTNQVQFLLSSRQSGLSMSMEIVPLTVGAGLEGSITKLQNFTIYGNLVNTNASNVNNLTVGEIAMISCDDWAYSGELQDSDVISIAAGKISQGNRTGAILLYSRDSVYCSYSQTNGFPYFMVYTMTSANMSNQLYMMLEDQPTSPPYVIGIDPSELNRVGVNDGGDYTTGSPPPTTAVAMIILYSITGIITLLFLSVIVTGAIRAHRHPERYGVRPVGLGRPRQSRARGIARAMLDSIPIVKFGERDDVNTVDKPASTENGDIEMGDSRAISTSHSHDAATETNPRAPTSSATTDGEKELQTPTAGVKALEGSDQVQTVQAQGTASDRVSGEQPSSDNNTTDNGLACSVCTDDFVRGQDVRVLPCKHKFHPDCIDPWLLNVSGTCPLCRTDLHPPSEQPASNTSTPVVATGGPGDPLPVAGTAPRRSTLLPSIIASHLNIRSMSEASAQERLDALRRLHAARQPELNTVDEDSPSDAAPPQPGTATAAAPAGAVAAAPGDWDTGSTLGRTFDRYLSRIHGSINSSGRSRR